MFNAFIRFLKNVGWSFFQVDEEIYEKSEVSEMSKLGRLQGSVSEAFKPLEVEG